MVYKNMLFIALFLSPLRLFGEGASVANKSEDVRLRLYELDGKISIIVENESDGEVKISRNFSFSPLVGVLTLSVERGGKRYPLLAQTEPVLPKKEDYISLRPGEIIGSIFDTGLIRDFYQAGGGCIMLGARYHDPQAKAFSAFNGVLTSNSIEVCD